MLNFTVLFGSNGPGPTLIPSVVRPSIIAMLLSQMIEFRFRSPAEVTGAGMVHDGV
jgi:hypothetical protein